MIDLSGQVALVTGGSRGIGRACCLMLARAGADVVLGYHRAETAANEVVAAVEACGRKALAVQGDLTLAEDNDRLFEAALSQMGRIDIVVANAGVWKRAPIDAMTLDEWRETMSANLDALYHLCRRSAPLMKKARAGKLILIGSTAGIRGEAEYAHYAASKGALHALVRSLAAELGPYGVNVNTVAPGWVLTDMTAAVFEDPARLQQETSKIPLRRIATPEDVAGAVLFLASNLARHVQGETLNVNGGAVMF